MSPAPTLTGQTGARDRRHSPTRGAQPRRDAPDGGPGAKAPASLDTVGTTLPVRPKGLASGHFNENAHGRAAVASAGAAPSLSQLWCAAVEDDDACPELVTWEPAHEVRDVVERDGRLWRRTRTVEGRARHPKSSAVLVWEGGEARAEARDGVPGHRWSWLPAHTSRRARAHGRCAPRGRLCATGPRPPRAPRAPEGRGARASWRRYAELVSRELVTLGHARTAERLRLCGTSCEVQTCHGCGDPHATVAVIAGCDVRACVLCARRRAARESARVAGAADRVAGYVWEALPRACDETARALAAREEQTRHTAARARELGRLRRVAGELRGAWRGRWAWRMITISPAWRPADRASYTPAQLAARLDEVRAAWRRLWVEHLSAGGYAAAYVSVELSAGGHVHLHALHYGPFARQDALERTARCMVDVRAARGDAVREVVKYALKAPTPRAGWMGGDSAPTTHPRLAAAWVVATRGRRLVEPYGAMRAALAAEDACGPGEEEQEREAPRCASCGSCDLTDPARRVTAHVAREAHELARATGRDRWTLRAEVASRAGGPTLPARVRITGAGM